MPKHIPGQARYGEGDLVRFRSKAVKDWDGRIIRNAEELEGCIEIVDAFGTFEQNRQPSYDIFVRDYHCLYKHVPEEDILEKRGTAAPEQRLDAVIGNNK